jgi:hypothetical protein
MCDGLGQLEAVRQLVEDRAIDTRCCVKQELQARGVKIDDVEVAELVCGCKSCGGAHEATGEMPRRAAMKG